jgi:hypothetical protein
MSSPLKRVLLFLLMVPVLLLFGASSYMLGMAWLEDTPRTFWQSLEWASETLTTTGYGADNRWEHPAMVALAIFMQLSGVILVVSAMPLALLPYLERRFETKLPRTVPEMEDHVVILHYGPAVETLLTEIDKAGIPTLVVEDGESRARRLLEEGYTVLVADDTDEMLAGAHLETARALVANGTDDQNAAIIVGARQEGFEGEVLALV